VPTRTPTMAATTSGAWPGIRPVPATGRHRHRGSLVCAAVADAFGGGDARTSPPPPPTTTTRRTALLAGTATAAAAAATPSPASAIVQVPDPLFIPPKKGSGPGTPAHPLIDAHEFAVPLRLVAPRGSVPGEWVADFRAALGKRGSVTLEARPQLGAIFADLASPEDRGAKSAATADGVGLGDEWLAAAVRRGLVVPIPGATHARWWARLHPRWRRLVTRDQDGRLADERSGGARVYAAPWRWGATLAAVRADKFSAARLPPLSSWEDLLHPRLVGRVGLPTSPRLFTALACAAAGVGLNPSARDLERVLGQRTARGDKSAAAAASLATTMARLRAAALLVSDRDAGRALAAGDAWVTVGSSTDLGPLAARSGAVALAAPVTGVPLWADLWTVPALASGGDGGVDPSPLLAAWLDYCLSAGRADAGRGLGALSGGASPLMLPAMTAADEVDRRGLASRLLRRTPPPRPPPPPSSGANLGPGGLPPPATLARSAFLEPLDAGTAGLLAEAWRLSEGKG
jgi:spermidine/putrescine-binding protein